MKMEQEHDGGRTYGLPTQTACPENNHECAFKKYNCGVDLLDRHHCSWASSCRDRLHGCGYLLKQCPAK